MKIALLVKDLQVTALDRQRIQDRIRVALTRFTPLIRGLTVTISDENGLRSGVDKKCRLVVRLHAGTVVVNQQADAVPTAVTLAAERAARTVARVHHRAIDSRHVLPAGGRAGREYRHRARSADAS